MKLDLTDYNTFRWCSIGASGVLAVMFGVGAYFVDGAGRDMLWWSSGAQFAYAVMWFCSPSITKAWRKQIEAEINQVAEECLRRMHTHLDSVWSPTIVSPDDPPKRSLQ